ncbi:hypothetical protein [Bacillus sp. LMB3902]|uniref:hypothetical protein n=1 Tax=Bacillus sp. LMB3902 TaxID=3139827 RepID=UPI003190214C
MMNVPEFKPNFKYSNIGNVVGTLVYAKELRMKNGELFGHEFLINAKRYGSVNVRVPKLEKSQYAMDNFPVSEKPRVRLGLTTLNQFVTDQGKVYTNATSFVEMSEAKRVDGSDMPDAINGRLGGEVFNLRMEGDIVKFNLISYGVDKEGNRTKLKNGQPTDPDIITLEVHDPALVQEFQAKVRDGSNIEVGYKYINRDDTTFDEYGFPVGSGERIERVEVGKLVVQGESQQPGPQGNSMGSFGQGNPGQQPSAQGGQQPGFGQQPPQQSNPFGQQNSGNYNPFAGAQTLPDNDPIAQQANQIFGNNGQGNGFPFGQ